MSRAAQKEWTKTMAMGRLRDINQAYEDVAKLADSGGKMPYRLRSMLKSAIARNAAVIEAFDSWKPAGEPKRRRMKGKVFDKTLNEVTVV